MRKLLGMIGSALGCAAGYWLGSFVGFGTALFASALGTAVGMYYGRRFLDDLIG